MSTTPVLIPVEEYLRTVYRPDRDFVDGEVQERNMGEKPHSRLQKFLLRYFAPLEDAGIIELFPEQRLYINQSRYRIPDVMLGDPHDPDPRIVRTPPILCIEILSSEDRMRRVQERLDDYASIGVQSMWVIDPWRGTASAAGPDAILHQVRDTLTVPGTPIAISVDAIFAELDRLEKRSARPR
jgi:Uma2 family endonuclease